MDESSRQADRDNSYGGASMPIGMRSSSSAARISPAVTTKVVARVSVPPGDTDQEKEQRRQRRLRRRSIESHVTQFPQ